MSDVYAIVIPALDPGNGLPEYVAALHARCGVPILLVDDGSGKDAQAVFKQCVAQTPDVSLLTHPSNLGKGRALKTAFAHLLDRCPDLRGCVTCDSDGQHAPEDVAKSLAALEEHPEALVLGCRTFDLPYVPWKSRVGNQSMCFLFRLATGRRFLDTQTGLRAIPVEFMRELLECRGERFEFETHMLLCLGDRPLEQVPIQTLYSDGNRTTHFRPVGDSARVVSILLSSGAKGLGKFTLSSLLSFALDISLFSALYYLVLSPSATGRLFLSVLFARTASLVFNYLCNRNFVFGKTRGNTSFDTPSFTKYLLLASAIMAASYALTRLGHTFFPREALPCLKACVDLLLFLLSYAIQRLLVFRLI